MPSKGLIQAARLVHQIRSAGDFGIRVAAPKVDFAAVMARVRAVVDRFAGSDSGDSLRARGIDVYRGSPAFEAYDTVILDGKTRIEAQRFVIATGSRPALPRIPGLAEAGALDNMTLWALDALPSSLVILGAGPTGLEFAQVFARLGSMITVLADSPHVLPREDPEVSDCVEALLAAEGIAFRTGVEVTGVEVRDGLKVCTYRDPASGTTGEASGTHLLVAAGQARECRGAEPRGRRHPRQPRARHRGRRLPPDAIDAHPGHRRRPEPASVHPRRRARGRRRLPERGAPATQEDRLHRDALGHVRRPRGRDRRALGGGRAQAHPDIRVFRAEFSEIDRARIDGRTEGFAKLVATPSGKILGATIVGADASLILQEFVLAMEHGLTLADIAETVHIYPTNAAMARKLANQFVATRLEVGFVRTVLRWFLGFRPRTGVDGGTPSPETEATHDHSEPAAHTNGHGH